MVKAHVEHQADSVFIRLADQGFRVFHSPEHRVYAQIIRDVVTIVIHWRLEKGRDPDIVDSQRLKVIQLGADSVQISDPVSVRVAVRFNINLIYRTVSEAAHFTSFLNAGLLMRSNRS